MDIKEKVVIRRGVENDRHSIATCIAEGFERDFSFFRKNMETVAKALEPGIRPEKFFVAVSDSTIIGVVGISDYSGRTVYTNGPSYRKHFGLVMGTIAVLVLKKEFEQPLAYPRTTGFIEFLAVRKQFRNQGVASFLLKESIKQTGYEDYILDVIEENLPAVSCYTKLGFQGFKRTKKKNGHTKLFMKLKRQNIQ